MQFSGAAVRATAGDISMIAATIGVELAAFRAVMSVESRNSGFDARNRPVILFEPHVFWRNLRGDARARAVNAGLAYSKWGLKPYSKTSDGNYERLARAIEIDAEAAFKSISVGMGQILGENHKAAGFSTARAMFVDAMESEANQLTQMVGFMRANDLIGPLKRKDWNRFARIYNGPGQVQKYSAWLAREYAAWKKRLADGPRDIRPTLRLGDSGGDVRVLQKALGVTVDGEFGPATLAAVKALQRTKGLDDDGIVGPKTWAALGL